MAEKAIIRCTHCGNTRTIPRDIAEQIGPHSQCSCGVTGQIYVVSFSKAGAV